MKHRDLLLVLAVLCLAGSAALLAPRDATGRPAWLAALLALLTLSAALIAWARWLTLGGPGCRALSLVLNGSASWIAVSLWLEFVFAELRGMQSPLRWALAVALAWMSAPFLGLLLTRLARRLGR